MSEPKFTKGPWSVCRADDCECSTVSSKNAPIAKVTRGDWGDDYPALRLVGDSSLDMKAEAYMEQITYGTVPPEEAAANAHLIAASPDLYAAAERLAKGLDNLIGLGVIHKNYADEASDLSDAAHEALSKARGEPQ